MGTDSFCLKWHDFETNVSHAFKDIKHAKDFLDVTLVCGEENPLQAHKLILSACSPVFYKILKSHPHQTPLLYLKGVKYTDMQSILTFMYNGEVSLPQDDLNSFLEVAEDLKIKGLTSNENTSTAASPARGTPSKRNSGGGADIKVTHNSRTRPSPNVLAPPPAKRGRGRKGASTGAAAAPPQDLPGAGDVLHIPPPSHLLSQHPPTSPLEVQQDNDDAKSVKSEPVSQSGKSGDGSLIDVDSMYGGMLEADVSIDENNENVENFSGVIVDEQSNDAPLDNKGMSIEQLANIYLTKADTGSGYICGVCGKRVRDRYAAQDHLECQHYPSFERYACEFCGKKLNARKLYLGHKNYCQKSNTAPYTPGGQFAV